MGALDSLLEELKRDFEIGCADRFRQLRDLCAEIEKGENARCALGELMRRFHSLAGVSGTCGCATIAELAKRAEEETDKLISRGGEPTPENLSRWRSLIRSMEEQISLHESANSLKAAASPSTASRPMVMLALQSGERCSTMSHLLQESGFDVSVASNIEGARSSISSRMPNALVADATIPGGSGYELVAWLREIPCGDIPTTYILCRANQFPDKLEAVRCGSNGYFVEPFDPQELVTRLSGSLKVASQEPPKVLSVEDDPDFARYIVAVLESGGYRVKVCSEPHKLESELSSFKPDLLLMDVNLPGAKGYELVRMIRNGEAYASLPIVFLTAQGGVSDRINALKAGGDDLLVKPAPPGLLLNAIASRIERAHLLNSMLDTDGLTGLLTHSAFNQRAAITFSRLGRQRSQEAALIMLDLDHFKVVNDSHGHIVGDRVLISLSGLLRKRLRQSDLIGRYGGEEFAIILEHLGEDDAGQIMAELLLEFKAIVHTGKGAVPFSCSFSAGISPFNPDFLDLEEWKKEADLALYEAKAAGRNRIKIRGAKSGVADEGTA